MISVCPFQRSFLSCSKIELHRETQTNFNTTEVSNSLCLSTGFFRPFSFTECCRFPQHDVICTLLCDSRGNIVLCIAVRLVRQFCFCAFPCDLRGNVVHIFVVARVFRRQQRSQKRNMRLHQAHVIQKQAKSAIVITWARALVS